LCNLKNFVNPAFIGKVPFYKGKPFNCEMNCDSKNMTDILSLCKR
jgi:hypothetical protein